jgi:hypothetical protein
VGWEERKAKIKSCIRVFGLDLFTGMACSYKNVCMCVCIYIYKNVHSLTHTYTYIHTHTYRCPECEHLMANPPKRPDGGMWCDGCGYGQKKTPSASVDSTNRLSGVFESGEINADDDVANDGKASVRGVCLYFCVCVRACAHMYGVRERRDLCG